MATRPDIGIRFDLDPRVLRVDGPSTELVVQDLHDTARDIEDEPGAMQYPTVIQTAGKEDLGGGISVGLTATLQNMIVAFDARKISVSQGTATSADSNGRILTDMSATFMSDGVLPGASVINFTDQSVGSVELVISETQVQLFPNTRFTEIALDDGTDNDWDISDVYKIWNVEQVFLEEGNVVAVDENSVNIPAILPTFGTQVVQSSSSSATRVDQTELETSIDDIATDVSLILAINQNRLEVNISTQELILYDVAGTSVIQRWALSTDGGENVLTATGVQTKRGKKLL